jgi:hypothetical protein
MNLLWFLTTVIQYRFSWDKTTSIQKLKQILDESGAVWQKFGQMLSTNEELIGCDLAIEMQKMLYDCPVHTDEYSRDIINQMFGNKYDLSEMILIGSGTIAQVYKVGDVCIKVRHPNVVREVSDAVAIYDDIKNSFFMPVAMKMVCDVFFEKLVEQLDFHREFSNGTILKELVHGGTDGTNNLFIIPRMLDTSDECLVMEYEPSQSIKMNERDKVDKHTLLRACYAISIFGNIYVYVGMLHCDLHFGNYGIRGDQIVIYDFGFMCDTREHDYVNKQALKSKYLYDIDIILTLLKFTPKDEFAIRIMLGDIHKGTPQLFYDYIEKTAGYIALNGIKVDRIVIEHLTALKHFQATNYISRMLEENDTEYCYYLDCVKKQGWVSLYDTYFKYDDIQKMRDESVILLAE